MLPTEQHRRARRGRPAVLDAERTAMIPLRPLTLIEIMDAAFVVIRRRPQVLIGLPMLIVIALVAQSAGLTIGVWLLGEMRSVVAQVIIGLLGVMLLTAVMVAAVMWVNAVLTRVSLEVLVGPGFAPAPRRLHLRTMLRMTPAIIALSLLQLIGMWVIQTALGVLSYVAVPATMIPDPVLQWIGITLVMVLLLGVTCWAYAYLALAVPAYMVENARTPAWIGKPWRPTTVLTAFARSIALIGFKQSYRAALVLAGTVVVCAAVFVASTVGLYGLFLSLVYTVQPELALLALRNPWAILGVVLAAQLISGTLSIAYLAAVQCVLYLDLRMRREGLDLALRFDQVAVPQPVPPPAAPPRMAPPPNAPPPAAPVQRPVPANPASAVP